MRGDDPKHAAMVSALAPEECMPWDPPWRTIRVLVEAMLQELSPHLERLDSDPGRPSIAPETWLRALLRQLRAPMRRERRLGDPLQGHLRFHGGAVKPGRCHLGGLDVPYEPPRVCSGEVV